MATREIHLQGSDDDIIKSRIQGNEPLPEGSRTGAFMKPSGSSDSHTLAILGYHKIGESPDGWESWFYVPEATFIDHLHYLHAHGWQVIGARAFLRGLAEPGGLPERAALLTFDDGYRSIKEGALRCLRRFKYPAVLFVPTNFIGGYNDWDLDVEPEEAICSWEELRALASEGISIQSHTASHRAFSELDLAEQETELRHSKRVLEAGLGRPVEIISYPYGDDGEAPEELDPILKRLGYRAGCLYGGDPFALPVADPLRLARLAMGPDTDLAEALAACE